MPSRLGKLIESVVYAGMKPSGSKPDAAGATADRPNWLRRQLDRLVAGRAPSDPLYLTNRSLGQKLRLPLIVGIPGLVAGGFIFMALSPQYFQPKDATPAELTPAQVATRMLPDLTKVQIDTNRDVEVVNARVEPGAGRLTGTVRNNTARKIGTLDMVFELADVDGSKMGAVKTQLKDIAAGTTTNFEFPIEQRTAVMVLVREVHPR